MQKTRRPLEVVSPTSAHLPNISKHLRSRAVTACRAWATMSLILALVTTSPAKQTLTHHLWCAAQNSYQRCLSSFRHVRLQIVRHDIFPKSRGTERWLPCCCSRWRPSHQGMQNWPPWEQVRVVIIFAASPNFCPIFIPLRELFDFCLKVPYLTQISHFLT